VLALVYLHAQSKLHAVGDVQPVEDMTAKLGQTQDTITSSNHWSHRPIVKLNDMTQ